jgi:hypothetical protein
MCTLYIVNVLNNEYADDKLNLLVINGGNNHKILIKRKKYITWLTKPQVGLSTSFFLFSEPMNYVSHTGYSVCQSIIAYE